MDAVPEIRRGSRVLVTGAAGGFGEPTVARLREIGAQVIGLDRTAGDGVIACDVTDDAAVTAAVDEAVGRLGGLDAVVHYAGVGTPNDAGGETPEEDSVGDVIASGDAAPRLEALVSMFDELLASNRGSFGAREQAALEMANQLVQRWYGRELGRIADRYGDGGREVAGPVLGGGGRTSRTTTRPVASRSASSSIPIASTAERSPR